SVWVDSFPDIDDDDLVHYKYFPEEPVLEQLLLYEKKTGLLFFNYSPLIATDYRFAWFSRPPPLV
ncbi:MAG: hypothetical protein ACLFUI_07185, partial [Halanaerobiales bacterium]